MEVENIVEATNNMISSESEWHWDVRRSIWLRRDRDTLQLIPDHRPLPEWFVNEAGTISMEMFLRLWNESSSFSELHQQLFWLSFAELQDFSRDILSQLHENGLMPSRQLAVESIDEAENIRHLIDSGLLMTVPDSSESVYDVGEREYDPMRALFEAQESRGQDLTDTNRPFFQSVEQGKFTAKH